VVEGDRSPSSLERMVFFSDAVFAIAITLLVLPLADSRFTDEDLARQILELAPKTFSFVLSFLVIGLLWIGHNRAFALISRVDRNQSRARRSPFQRMPSATSGCIPTSFPCATYRASLSLLCR
jgi:uncharacterized membrane protein